MKKCLSLFILTLAVFSESKAQFTRYLVKLKNKGGSPYSFSSPLVYLSQRSIDRRTRYSIPLDSTDLPVTPSYITQIMNVPNVTLLNVSKWLNSISIQTSDPNAITTINGFPFVESVGGIAARFVSNGRDSSRNKFGLEEIGSELPQSTQRIEGITGDYFNYGTTSYNEIHLHNGEFLHNIGLRGQGMQIAMLDNGFNNYSSSSFHAFDSANANNQVLGTWDFVAHNQIVTDDGNHGMSCFSTIVANIPGQFIGTSPKANFWLYQTEDNSSEYPIEEHNWSCGAERADSSGADVISCSLGYFTFDNPIFDHTYSDMNGNTTMAAIAADMAAKKGILLFNSVGNIINGPTYFLSTPADGNSVVAVGAVDVTGIVAGFSSHGPSSDGRVKPDLASVGVNAMIENSGGSVSFGSGTSFACPKLAGLGTCLWQGFPEFNNMKIIRAMQQAGSIASSPDDRIGYGIPNMKTAFSSLLVDFATSSASVNVCTATVSWTSKDVDAMKYEIERKVPGEIVYTKVGELSPQAGSLLATHSYQFNNTIISPTPGTVSFRIRQIIDTTAAGFAAAYIDTAIVNITSGCFATGTGNIDPNKVSVTVQPNPVSGNSVTLIIETPYAVNHMPVSLYDGSGKLMMQLQYAKGSGKLAIDLSVNKLAKGKYYIKVSNNQKTIGIAELLKL